MSQNPSFPPPDGGSPAHGASRGQRPVRTTLTLRSPDSTFSSQRAPHAMSTMARWHAVFRAAWAYGLLDDGHERSLPRRTLTHAPTLRELHGRLPPISLMHERREVRLYDTGGTLLLTRRTCRVQTGGCQSVSLFNAPSPSTSGRQMTCAPSPFRISGQGDLCPASFECTRDAHGMSTRDEQCDERALAWMSGCSGRNAHQRPSSSQSV